MSTTLIVPSRWLRSVGFFLLLLLIISAPSAASTIPRICLAGYSSMENTDANEPAYTLNAEQEPHVGPALQQWLIDHDWRQGYSNWQQSRQCGTALVAGPECDIADAPLPSEGVCGGIRDGYDFLVMHRYLLQTLKSLRPDLEQQFSDWKKFPQLENYPEEIQRSVHAWPDEVIRAAAVVDTLAKSKIEEIQQRWPTEGHFGRWLQCGGDDGLGVDALYGALITNAIDIPADDSQARRSLLDLYLFWQAHSWIDLAWEKYRRASGKMPDEPELQAALIQQCAVFQFWLEHGPPAEDTSEPAKAQLYKGGHFNPAYNGGLVRVIGEVNEIKEEKGKLFVRIDPHLHGVNYLWVSSNISLNSDALKIGGRFTFVGTVVSTDQFAPNNPTGSFQSPAILLAAAIQTVK